MPCHPHRNPLPFPRLHNGRRPLTDSIANLSTKNWRAWRLKISCLSRHIRKLPGWGGGKEKGDKSHPMAMGRRHCHRTTRDSTWRPAPWSGMFLPHRVAVQACDRTQLESHYCSCPLKGYDLISTWARAQAPSRILFLALRWRAIYKSLTSRDPGS